MPAIPLPIPAASRFTGTVASVSRASLDKDPREVASMFDAVARRYDLTNTVLVAGSGPVLATRDARGAAHRSRRQGARPGGGHRGVDGGAGGVGRVVCGRGLLGRHARRGRGPRRAQGRGRRDAVAVRRRGVRRRDDQLRAAQRRRPRRGAARDGAGDAAGWSAGGVRVLDADESRCSRRPTRST